MQTLALPFIAARMLNRLIEVYRSQPSDYWHVFMPYLVAFIVIGVFSQVATSSSMFMLAKLQVSVRKRLEERIYSWLLGHSLNFHANSFSGSLVAQSNRFAGAYVTVGDALIISGSQLFVKSIVAIIVIAFFSLPIAAVMFVWVLSFSWLNIYLTRRRMHLSRAAAVADSVLTAHLADSMGNINVIKAFAQEAEETAAYSHKALDRAVKKYRAWSRAIKNGIVYWFMMLLIQLIVLVLSVYAVMHQQIQISTLILLQTYVMQLTASLWDLGNLMKNVEQAFSDASEMSEILYTPQEVTDPAKPQKTRITKGAITFTHMDFTHGETKKDDALFHDFNLHIKAGEKIGLVGHSGSGKTTLTRLLLRFSDIDAGTITIDDQNIAKITQADVRKAIAYVPQEPLLFHRTLRENISYGKPGATDEEIRMAAKKAYATEFIDKLPHGYETMVGERGVKLSGGQRQRIAIARAILKDAPILLLDEATSALDSESEKLIQAALTDLMKHRTAIIIAHRLSTVQKMNRIVVLENGSIVEQGSHQELVVNKGIYAELWKHQSGGFIEE
jgi:ATP-binding cassette subfamily B protein